MRLVLLSAVLVAFWTGTAVAGEAGTVYPLKIGPTRRYLVDQRGSPVFINGATPWSLAAQLSREDVELYLEHRAALGVNSLIVTIPEAYYADGCRDEDEPNDFYGNKPFLTRNDFTTPNPKYFAHADWVIRRAGDWGNANFFPHPVRIGCWYWMPPRATCRRPGKHACHFSKQPIARSRRSPGDNRTMR